MSKKITKKIRASDAERKKKQVSDAATANSLDNCDDTNIFFLRNLSVKICGSAYE